MPSPQINHLPTSNYWTLFSTNYISYITISPKINHLTTNHPCLPRLRCPRSWLPAPPSSAAAAGAERKPTVSIGASEGYYRPLGGWGLGGSSQLVCGLIISMWLIGSFRSTSSGDAGLNEDGKKQLIWVVVETSIFYVHPEIGEMIQFDKHIFQLGWTTN